MKKAVRIMVAVMVSLFGTISLTRAASVGLNSEKKGLSTSVEYTHVFDQELDKDAGSVDSEIDKIDAVLAKLNYAFNEYVSLYTKLGSADIDVNLAFVKGADRANYQLEHDFGFAWGGGIQASLPLGDSEWRSIFDLQYLRWDSEVNSVKVNNISASAVSSTDAEVTDLSLSALLAKKWTLSNGGVLTPYAGVKLSHVVVDYGTLSHAGITVGSTTFSGFSGDISSENKVGAVMGTEYQLNDRWSLAVEGRLVDETAITGSAKYRF